MTIRLTRDTEVTGRIHRSGTATREGSGWLHDPDIATRASVDTSGSGVILIGVAVTSRRRRLRAARVSLSGTTGREESFRPRKLLNFFVKVKEPITVGMDLIAKTHNLIAKTFVLFEQRLSASLSSWLEKTRRGLILPSVSLSIALARPTAMPTVRAASMTRPCSRKEEDIVLKAT